MCYKPGHFIYSQQGVNLFLTTEIEKSRKDLGLDNICEAYFVLYKCLALR